MAFTGKVSPESRAYALFAMKCKRLRKKDIIEQVNISRASLYRILKQKKDAKRKKARASEDTVFGRSRKLGPKRSACCCENSSTEKSRRAVYCKATYVRSRY